VFHSELEVVVVQEVMVCGTQQRTVRDIRGAAVLPPFDVMGVTPGGRRGALRPDAPAVAHGEREALRGRKQSPRAAQGKNLAVVSQGQQANVGIASEFSNRGARHGLDDTIEPAHATARLVILGAHCGDDGCSGARNRVVRIHPRADHAHEDVEVALPGCALVVENRVCGIAGSRSELVDERGSGSGRGVGVEHGAKFGRTDRICLAAERSHAVAFAPEMEVCAPTKLFLTRPRTVGIQSISPHASAHGDEVGRFE